MRIKVVYEFYREISRPHISSIEDIEKFATEHPKHFVSSPFTQDTHQVITVTELIACAGCGHEREEHLYNQQGYGMCLYNNGRGARCDCHEFEGPQE